MRLLKLDGAGPRYAQITRAVAAAIQSGALAPGARLPSSRDLAHDTGCARNVVLLAYDQLLLEGYLVSRAGAGTFVSPDLAPRPRRTHAAAASPRPRPAPLSRSGRLLDAAAARARTILRPRRGLAINFMYGVCEPDSRMIGELRAALAAALRTGAFAYSPPAGDPALRAAIAERLRGIRAIDRSADALVITSGTQQALDILARLLLAPGDAAIVEDPCYASARAIFEASGADVIPVPVDRQGLDVARVRAGRRRVRLAYVTPSHQFPTGAVLPASRRQALLDWAASNGAYVVEDDYDGEFRYEGRRLAALSAIDPDGPVIYIGTFAKALFPAMRLGYLSLPAELVEAAVSAKWLTDFGSSLLLQRALASLMTSGAYDRHVRRMTRRYRARRDALLEAAAHHFGRNAIVEGSAAGLHVVMWLPGLGPRRLGALIDACAARDVAVYPLAPHAAAPPPRAALLLGYGLVDPPAIAAGVQSIADAYREVTRGMRASRRRSTAAH